MRTTRGLAILLEGDSAKTVMFELTEATVECILEPLLAYVYDLERGDDPQYECFRQETLSF